jgi:hypothetical protein
LSTHPARLKLGHLPLRFRVKSTLATLDFRTEDHYLSSAEVIYTAHELRKMTGWASALTVSGIQSNAEEDWFAYHRSHIPLQTSFV